jgi:hypothetical protein
MVTFTELTEAIEDTGRTPRSYDGMASFGRACVAVFCDDYAELWEMAVRAGEIGAPIPAPKVEGAGPGRLVASWPTVEWEGERSDDPEEA